MFHAAQTPLHLYEARTAEDAAFAVLGASFEDAALAFADLVHQGQVELTDCESGERRCFTLEVV